MTALSKALHALGLWFRMPLEALVFVLLFPVLPYEGRGLILE